MSQAKTIWVTQPSLAPLKEFLPYLRQIWKTGVMTHNGPLMQRLERELAAFLGVPDVACVANGTCAMQVAIRALDLAGEIITTPFSFIATANVIAWERCVPVFVDIDPATWNLDPDLIEAAITPRTSAILPVHVFGRPCDTERIDGIARRHGLKVVYDAAHALGVQVAGQSVLLRGDVGCASFHATKIFNTCEGGACVSADPALMARIRRLRFFGFDERKEIVDGGMNAKMTEISAALGLANLAHLPEVMATRRRKYELYRHELADCPHVRFQAYRPDEYNFCYMPVLFDSEERLLAAERELQRRHIVPRRYFHPALDTLGIFGQRDALPISRRVAACILCLPLYTKLADAQIKRICAIVATC